MAEDKIISVFVLYLQNMYVHFLPFLMRQGIVKMFKRNVWHKVVIVCKTKIGNK